MRRLLAVLPLALLTLATPAAHAVPPICAQWVHGCDVAAYVTEWCHDLSPVGCPV